MLQWSCPTPNRGTISLVWFVNGLPTDAKFYKFPKGEGYHNSDGQIGHSIKSPTQDHSHVILA